MHAANVDAILERTARGSVLDIGGWAQPLTNATHVVDVMPYETRAPYGSIGGGPERFSADTWVVADICADRLPFDDDQFDFVLCSQTLEDLRDPLAACAEIMRIGRAGYIEVPSRELETTWGVEGRYPGFYHHRWLVDPIDDGLRFRYKSALLSSSPRFHLPAGHQRSMSPDRMVTWLVWENSFVCEEVVQMSREETACELEAFVRSIREPGRLRLGAEQVPRSTKELRRQIARIRGRNSEPREIASAPGLTFRVPSSGSTKSADP